MSQDNKDSLKHDNSQESTARLNTLEEMLGQIDKNKKRTSIIGYAGMIIVVITILILVNNVYSFFNNYDTLTLAKEIQSRLPSLTESKSANELYTTIEGKVLPKYSKALMSEFKDKAPLFAQDILAEKNNLCLYLQNNVKAKLANNLVDNLTNSESQNLAIYFKHKLPPEKLLKISRIVHDVLHEKLTKEMNILLLPAMEDIKNINETFETLYINMHAAGEFKGITPATVGEIENRFIEALLESIIYEINPQKGSEPSSDI